LAKTAEFGDRVLVELEDADDRGFLPFSATQPIGGPPLLVTRFA
jgi:hypothetical protein